jgi:hypothetical protein
LGLFVEHLVGAQKIKGLKTPFKSAQPPTKTAQKPTQNNGAQFKSGFVPNIYQKNEKKNGEFLEKWGFGKNGKKRREKWANGGRRWVEMAGGGAVGGWEVVGGSGVWWVWIIGSVWRRRTEKEGGGVYGRYREMRGMGEKMT